MATASDAGGIDAATVPADGGGDSAPTCPSPVLKPGDIAETVLGNRTYILRIPEGYDGSRPVPLLLDFHATAGTGSQEEGISSYPGVVDSEGVIMAFPDGLTGPAGSGWNVGGCCVSSDIDDVAFARALVKQVQGIACVDSKRIYAVGLYTGGGMAYALACRAADVFAAVAATAWDLLQENVAQCSPFRPVTIVSFRDTTDNSFIPYGGGSSSLVPRMTINFLGAQATFKKWAELDRCAGSPSSTDSNGCSTYSSCQAGVEVTLCSKPGGLFPGGTASIAWPILKRHPLP